MFSMMPGVMVHASNPTQEDDELGANLSYRLRLSSEKQNRPMGVLCARAQNRMSMASKDLRVKQLDQACYLCMFFNFFNFQARGRLK